MSRLWEIFTMIKSTVTIEETQDNDIKDIQSEKSKPGAMLNYSETLRLIIDEGLKKF